MFFSIQVSDTILALLAISVICIGFLLTVYRHRISLIYKRQKYDENIDNSDDTALTPVSVVVYSKDDANNLARLLPEILNQDYQEGFEVIVVNDGVSEATRNIVEKLEMSHHNLYLTFTPEDSRNLSRKKMSLTIGIKAAHNEIVVTIDSAAVIPSDQWLKKIARHFQDNNTEIVIGYAAPVIHDDKMAGKWRMAFDIAAIGVTYLSAAISGHPYRGTGLNLAYRRDTFFKNKGFSRSLNLKYGDDDIFVNDIANRKNTVVELSHNAIPEYRIYNPKAIYTEMKLRYGFTSRYIRKGARRFFGFCSLLMWIWFFASIATIIMALPNMLPIAVIVALALLLWIPLMFTWRNAITAIKSPKMFFTIPYFVLARPLYNFAYKLKGMFLRKQNYTWYS